VSVIVPWTQPRAGYSQLVTPPAVEPFTVKEAKVLAAMTWPETTPPDPRDQMMTDFIAAARSQVEHDTGLALLTQEHDVYVLDPVCFVSLPVQCTPVQTISALGPLPAASSWGLTASGRGFVLARPTTGVWRVKSGWPDVAALKQEAPGLMHAVGLLVAHFATIGRDIYITGAVASVNLVPLGYEEAIAPYRLITVV
jgi:hypothetical protein